MSDKQPQELVPFTPPTTRNWKTDPPPSSSAPSQHPPRDTTGTGQGELGGLSLRGTPALRAWSPHSSPSPGGCQLQPLPGTEGHSQGQLQGQLQPSPRVHHSWLYAGSCKADREAGTYRYTHTGVHTQLQSSCTGEKGSARAGCRRCSTAEAGGQPGLPCKPPNPQEPRAPLSQSCCGR